MRDDRERWELKVSRSIASYCAVRSRRSDNEEEHKSTTWRHGELGNNVESERDEEEEFEVAAASEREAWLLRREETEGGVTIVWQAL